MDDAENGVWLKCPCGEYTHNPRIIQVHYSLSAACSVCGELCHIAGT